MKNRVLVFSAVTAIVAAFAWGGCSSEDDSNGTAGTAGTAGKAGAAGKAGSAGKAGEAGAAGSTAGSAGEAGSAGAAGSTAGSAGAAGSTAGSGGGTQITLPAGCYKIANIPCNPLTNEGCDSAAGEACDLADSDGTFQCWPPPPPNTVDVGGDCDVETALCKGGATCGADNKCEKFCCADSDCPSDRICMAWSDTIGTLGTCVLKGADPGTACTKAEDCLNTSLMICDPAGTGCQAGQCDGSTQCATGKVCMGQVSDPAIGACYTECKPFDATTGCANDEACTPAPGGSSGACFKLGTGTAGQACAPADSDLSSKCVAGLTCVSDGTSEKCQPLCNYWGTPGCADGTGCDALWMACVANGENGVAIGGACTGDTGTPCALNAGKYAGVCISSKCEQWCRTDADCTTTGHKCTGDVGLTDIMVCEAP